MKRSNKSLAALSLLVVPAFYLVAENALARVRLLVRGRRGPTGVPAMTTVQPADEDVRVVTSRAGEKATGSP